MTATYEPEQLSAWARRIEAGDSEAETELVQALGRGLEFLLRRWVQDPELAKDFYQETFHVVLKSLRRGALDDPTKVAAFVRGTAQNLVRSQWRKDQRRGVHDNVDEIPIEEPSGTPWEQATAAEDRRLVSRLLSEMPLERDRQILYRHYLAEESKEEICRRLDIDDSQFALVLFRARKRFKRLLEDAERKGDFRRWAKERAIR